MSYPSSNKSEKNNEGKEGAPLTSHWQEPISSVSTASNPPPPYSQQPRLPPGGNRIPLITPSQAPFPDSQQTGAPPCYDSSGSPIYIGSALLVNSVHPCKIGPHLAGRALVAYGGREYPHNGRYDLLPFVPELMEFVTTSHGRIPPGRRPISGGFEESGRPLYHAMAMVNGTRVPGKTGEHLGGCNVGYGGREHAIEENYEILCWNEQAKKRIA